MTRVDAYSALMARLASRLGTKAAIYANHRSCDVLTERDGLVFWVRGKTEDVVRSVRAAYRKGRCDMKRAWA